MLCEKWRRFEMFIVKCMTVIFFFFLLSWLFALICLFYCLKHSISNSLARGKWWWLCDKRRYEKISFPLLDLISVFSNLWLCEFIDHLKTFYSLIMFSLSILSPSLIISFKLRETEEKEISGSKICYKHGSCSAVSKLYSNCCTESASGTETDNKSLGCV